MTKNKITTYVLLVSLVSLISLISSCDQASAKERCLRGNEGQGRARYTWIPANPTDVPWYGLTDNYGTCTVATGSRG